FLLTLIEIAKARYEIDPDRVYVAGFSMGGTGSWHLAGRHPDLLAAALPAHGVLMAGPVSQVRTPEEIQLLQHGLVPNVRNLPIYFYTGLEDENCMPGTFLYVHDLLRELAENDPGGYTQIEFAAHPELAHSFPPGEPGKGLKWIAEKRRDAFPEKIVWEYAAEPAPPRTRDDPIERPRKEWFYWLHCMRPVDTMTVVAERKGNEFDISVKIAFAEDLTLYLNPAMIDVEEDVVVRVDGEVVWRGRPRPDFVSVLESLDARLDRTLVFDRRIRLEEEEEEGPTTGS
ncbi:MAG: dienelactone hydrolase family protein, partial [Planctomycetota bacterium]